MFRHTKKQLIHTLNTPCYICNVQASDGSAMEAHHHPIEYSFALAINWELFGAWATKGTTIRTVNKAGKPIELVAPGLYNVHTGEEIGPRFDWAEVAAAPELYIDSIHNMMSLCSFHHRSTTHGTHHIDGPDWGPQKFAVEGFDFLGHIARNAYTIQPPETQSGETHEI